MIVTQDVTPDAAESAIIDKYAGLSAPLANRVVGSITADIRSRRDTPAARTRRVERIGDVIADAQLEATAPDRLRGRGRRVHEPGRDPGWALV